MSGILELAMLSRGTTPKPRGAMSLVATRHEPQRGKEMETPEHLPVPQDSKNIAVLTWIGTVFLGFIPGLIIYLVKKDDAYVQDQAKESLNWSITAIIGYIAGIVLTFVLIGPLVMLAVGICHLVFCILGAVGTSKGESFRVPFALRLIK
jgi:uncharacterized Tic20 family protein